MCWFQETVNTKLCTQTCLQILVYTELLEYGLSRYFARKKNGTVHPHLNAPMDFPFLFVFNIANSPSK